MQNRIIRGRGVEGAEGEGFVGWHPLFILIGMIIVAWATIIYGIAYIGRFLMRIPEKNTGAFLWDVLNQPSVIAIVFIAFAVMVISWILFPNLKP